jgi:hypothetical protein
MQLIAQLIVRHSSDETFWKLSETNGKVCAVYKRKPEAGNSFYYIYAADSSVESLLPVISLETTRRCFIQTKYA